MTTLPKKGDRVRVLEIHADDSCPYVEAGNVVELTADATEYDGEFLNVHALGGLSYARIEDARRHPIDGSDTTKEHIERVTELRTTDDKPVPFPIVEPPMLAVHSADGSTPHPAAECAERGCLRDAEPEDDGTQCPQRADDCCQCEPCIGPVPVFMSTDSQTRKLMPLASGVLGYFPDALLLVSWISRVGNEKHNPGQPLHWAKEKSADEPDAEARHMIDFFRGLPPDPGLEPLGPLGHLASKAWRALAHLQRACDAERKRFEDA